MEKINKFMETENVLYDDYNTIIPVAKRIISNKFDKEVKEKYGKELWIDCPCHLFDSIIESVWVNAETLKISCCEFIEWYNKYLNNETNS